MQIHITIIKHNDDITAIINIINVFNDAHLLLLLLELSGITLFEDGCTSELESIVGSVVG